MKKRKEQKRAGFGIEMDIRKKLTREKERKEQMTGMWMDGRMEMRLGVKTEEWMQRHYSSRMEYSSERNGKVHNLYKNFNDFSDFSFV